MNDLIQYFTALEQRLAALEQDNADLKDRVASFKTKTAALEEEIAALQDAVTTLGCTAAKATAPADTGVTPDATAAADDEPEIEVELIMPEDEPEEQEIPAEPEAPVGCRDAKATASADTGVTPDATAAAAMPQQQPQQRSVVNSGVTLSPVDDIKKAISLGDRFLFQRELFSQNGELMQKTLEDINGCHSLDEAHAYIDKHFKWDKDSSTYTLFETVLNRRFC